MSEKKQMQLLIDQFDSFGFYLDDKLDRDIEENRKGAFSLSFTDENGEELEEFVPPEEELMEKLIQIVNTRFGEDDDEEEEE